MSSDSDRDKLEVLRISVARIAQAVGVENSRLPVLDRGDGVNVFKLASEQERGWNALCAAIIEELERRKP